MGFPENIGQTMGDLFILMILLSIPLTIIFAFGDWVGRIFKFEVLLIAMDDDQKIRFSRLQTWQKIFAILMTICTLPLYVSMVMVWIAIGVKIVIYVSGIITIMISSKSGIIPLVAIAVALYGIRTRYQFFYGASEFIVGVAAIWYSILQNQNLNDNGQRLVATLGGIYIIVRGLDNMDKQIPPALSKYWFFVRWGVNK